MSLSEKNKSGTVLQSYPDDAPLRSITVDPLDAAGFEVAWHELASKAVDPNPFFGPDFLIPFAQAQQDDTLRVHAVVDQHDRWLMAAPFQLKRQFGLFGRQVCYATEFGPVGIPIMAPDAPKGTVETFLKGLGSKASLIALRYADLKCETATAIRKARGWSSWTALQQQRASHSFGETGDQQYQEAFRGKRKKEISRLKRRLAEQGDLRFENATGIEACTRFEDFLLLEQAGWKGTEETALASSADIRSFARKLIQRRADHNSVRIDSMLLDGKPIAMLVSFIENDRVFAWKTAFDESFARFSPGVQLMMFSFECNLSNKRLRGADSLAIPGHPMIEPLWRGRLDFGTMILARRGPAQLLQWVSAGLLELKMAIAKG